MPSANLPEGNAEANRGRLGGTGGAGREEFRRSHERHYLTRVTPRTRAKALNTAIEPGVDMDAD